MKKLILLILILSVIIISLSLSACNKDESSLAPDSTVPAIPDSSNIITIPNGMASDN